jgi:hypothetical protein
MGQVETPACTPTSPLATFAHLGEPGEVEGRGVGWVSWRIAGSAGRATTPQVGEARWRGPRQVDHAASLLLAPAQRGGGGGAGGLLDVRVKGGDPPTTKDSSGLEG